MHSMRNFSLDDTLFPRVPRNSFLYEGDVHDELEWQGFDIPTYVDTSLKVASISMPISASGKPLAASSWESTTAQAPDSATLFPEGYN